MCVIIVKKFDTTLSKDLVSKLWDKNPDGAGYMVRHKDTGWKHRKGIMGKEDFLKSIEGYLDKDSELVTHMRIKTKGSICEEHTHPFDFSKANDPRFMFHNGTVKFLSHKTDSDSMFLAKIIKNVTTNEAHDLLKNFSESGYGRFVTIANDKVSVFGDAESIEVDGVWFSNKRHTEPKTITHTVYGEYGDYEHCDWTAASRTQSKPQNSKDQLALTYPLITCSPHKRELLNDLGKFYALKAKVAWNEDFQGEFEEENGANTIQDALLEKIVELSKQDKEYKSDPLFEFYLVFGL